MAETNYREMYDAYWARSDRWGTHSFSDVGRLIDAIVSTCGGGAVLDVGCGMGLLVRALLARGIDAYGIDVASGPVEAANRCAPGRFRTGSILHLPRESAAFPTVVCTDVLEHLAESDVPKALSELARVTQRFAYVTVATTADRDGRWHLTVHDRAWWETRFFEAGFRKHPRMQTVFPYETLESDASPITLVLEKIPPDAFARYPLETLRAERDLHMDMLRETGRRSDAHVARYVYACRFVRPGDVVADVACGLGYGSAILSGGTPAASVLGVDDSPAAIEYAAANFAADDAAIEFRCADAADLSFLRDASVDVVVSFETLEHLREPEAFLREAHRILRPAGRIVLSVPNDWTDDTGEDPNPHHLHVYDWNTLREQLGRHFSLERAAAQTAGGGMKLTDRPREIKDVPIDRDLPREAEWWLMVGMKDAVAAAAVPYEETVYPDPPDDEGYHVTAFERDYDNPWLVRGMVSIGLRSENPQERARMAGAVLRGARPGSADQGAALCVLGYRLLDDPNRSRDDVHALLEGIQSYHRDADETAHTWRWRISNQYLAGRLLLAVGERDRARAAFLACAALDCTKFSPLLATKTVDALFYAGLISASAGDTKEAHVCWERGLTEVRRVLGGDWLNIWGRTERPVPFGIPEVKQLLERATRCANGLIALKDWSSRPGWAWVFAHANMDRDFLERQQSLWRALAEEREQTIRELRTWATELDTAKTWVDEQRVQWKQVADQREQTIQELRAWIEQREEIIQELRDWIATLEKRVASAEP